MEFLANYIGRSYSKLLAIMQDQSRRVLRPRIDVCSALIGVPLGRLCDKAIEAEAGRRPVEDVVRDMAASSAVFFFPVNAAIFAAIIVDMVLKPF